MPTAPEGIVHRLSMSAAPWRSQSARRVRRRTARRSCRQLPQIGPTLLLKKIHVRAADAVLHPALVDLRAQGPDQPQTAAGVRENPDDLRPPLDLLVRTLKHVRRTHPKMMLARKPQERERLLDRRLDPIAKLRLRRLPFQPAQAPRARRPAPRRSGRARASPRPASRTPPGRSPEPTAGWRRSRPERLRSREGPRSSLRPPRSGAPAAREARRTSPRPARPCRSADPLRPAACAWSLAPRLLPKASACAGGSCRASIPAASRLARRRHSWPPAASKQTKASLSPATASSFEWPSSVFGRRNRRSSLKQWMSSQSRETSKPMISGCAAVFILSSFRCAVLGGRNRLFETMKRGGAGRLGSVVMPQESRAMRRPVADLRQGRRDRSALDLSASEDGL